MRVFEQAIYDLDVDEKVKVVLDEAFEECRVKYGYKDEGISGTRWPVSKRFMELWMELTTDGTERGRVCVFGGKGERQDGLRGRT